MHWERRGSDVGTARDLHGSNEAATWTHAVRKLGGAGRTRRGTNSLGGRPVSGLIRAVSGSVSGGMWALRGNVQGVGGTSTMRCGSGARVVSVACAWRLAREVGTRRNGVCNASVMHLDTQSWLHVGTDIRHRQH